MSGDADRGLLERATAVLERHEKAFEDLFRRMDKRDRLTDKRDQLMDEREARASERHEALMREHRRLLDRFAASEDRVVEALGDLHLEVARNTARLDDMRGGIRADTQAVLSMLDRLGPAPG